MAPIAALPRPTWRNLTLHNADEVRAIRMIYSLFLSLILLWVLEFSILNQYTCIGIRVEWRVKCILQGNYDFPFIVRCSWHDHHPQSLPLATLRLRWSPGRDGCQSALWDCFDGRICRHVENASPKTVPQCTLTIISTRSPAQPQSDEYTFAKQGLK